MSIVKMRLRRCARVRAWWLLVSGSAAESIFNETNLDPVSCRAGDRGSFFFRADRFQCKLSASLIVAITSRQTRGLIRKIYSDVGRSLCNESG
jgi:hypothetical protein